MKKSIWGVSSFTMAMLLMASCQNNEMDSAVSEKPIADIEVVNMADYAGTRSNGANMPVLKFKNMEIYNQTIHHLQGMNYEQKDAFFKELGFEGAFSTLYKADMELDKIFDIEDDKEFLNAYSNFQQKYDGNFVYNTENKYDLSPYLPFTDANLELVGNVDGAVVIGNQVKYAEQTLPNYLANATPYAIDAQAFKGFAGTEFKIKQGKYYSTVETGYHPASGELSVYFKAFKKKSLWTRRHPATFSLSINVSNKLKTDCGTNEQHEKFRLGLGINKTLFPAVLTINYSNFKSSCTGDVVGNKSLSNIQNI